MAFELIHKPTFTNQLQVVPAKDIARILRAIELLSRDPTAQTPRKAKLRSFSGNIYSLSVGVYRVIYTYSVEGNWIALLGVDHRKDVYSHHALTRYESAVTEASSPFPDDSQSGKSIASLPFEETESQDQREHMTDELNVDSDLLVRLGIPVALHSTLIGCHTLDDLLDANIPVPVKELVFDAITMPNYDSVLTRQPTYITGDLTQLRRYVTDKTVDGFVLLTPEQADRLPIPEQARDMIRGLKQSSLGERHTRIDGMIFVSHSHADAAFSQALVLGLKQKGAEVWYDEDNLMSGSLRRAVEKALEASQHFIVVLSPDAIQSNWVDEEIDAALDLLRGGQLKTFLPIVARQCKVPLLLKRYKRIEHLDESELTAAEAAEQVVRVLSTRE